MSQASQFKHDDKRKGGKCNDLNKGPMNNFNPPKPMPLSSIGLGERPAFRNQSHNEWTEKDSGSYNNQKYNDILGFSFQEIYKNIYENAVGHNSFGIVKQEANSSSLTDNEWAEKVSTSSPQRYQINDNATIFNHEVLTVNKESQHFEEKKLKEKNIPISYMNKGRGKNFNSTKDEFLPKDSGSSYFQKCQNNHPGTKKNVENDNSENLSYLCTACEKAIHKKSISYHRTMGHDVLPVNQALAKLKEKKSRESYKLEKKAQSILYSIKQMTGMLDSSHLIIGPLIDTFESLKKSTAENTNDLTASLEIPKVPEKAFDFVQFFKFKNDSDKLETKLDAFLFPCIPFWLLSSFFKMSLGLMLHSGRIICTISDNAISTLDIQGDRILLPCLRKIDSPLHKDAIVLPFNFMASIFDDNSSAYMKISSSQQDLGYVFVRVDLETFWGRQFLEMCTGTRGYSYRNTRFFRICRRNRIGDHIWTGDYSMNDGSGGAQVLGDNSEPLHTNPKPVVEGLIAARYGYQDRSTIFRIYIGEKDVAASKNPTSVDDSRNPDFLDFCAFGYVVDGMQYLCHITELPNIKMGVIQDVGRNLSLN